MDVTQFGCDQVLHCVHVLFVVVGNTPRPGPSAHELAVLALRGHSSHQNVIAYREMRQSLAAIPHAVPLKPSHRRIDPAVSGPLQVGIHQQSLLQRVGPGRHPDHAVAMVLHPRQPLGIPRSHPHRRITGGSALRSGRLHAAHNLLRRKLVAPSEKHLRVLDARVRADRTLRPRHPTRQQVCPAVLIAIDVHDRRSTRRYPHGPCTWLKPHGHRLHARRRVAQQNPTEYLKVRAKNDLAQHLGTFWR